MDSINSISIQELRRDPVAFLERIKNGQTITVIYHSKPYATVKSASYDSLNQQPSGKALVAAARLIRAEAAKSSVTFPPDTSFKDIYYADMTEKYDL